MVKFTNGDHWSFTDAEVWGAHSFAGLLVAGTTGNWLVARNYIHDTYPTNGINQDHLIYVNADGPGGVIERNLLVNSENGRAVKVGPATATGSWVTNVTIRHNTMNNNLGPSNIQIAWQSSNTDVYGNIMVKPGANRSTVTAFQLTGTGNHVHDNLYWDAARAADTAVTGLTVGTNLNTNPLLTGTGPDMHATNPAAAPYGHTAV